MSSAGKIIFFTNSAWTLYQFRLSLMLAMQTRGFEVVACAPQDKYASQFDLHGIRFVDVPMSLVGLNPVQELAVISRLWRVYRQEKPVLVHHFSTKPIIYGSLAAHLARVPAVVNTVTGLGYIFSQQGWMQRLVKGLYKLALHPPIRVTFQNPADRQYFIDNNLVKSEYAALVLGSGINTDKFAPTDKIESITTKNGTTEFLMYGRMLWEKGVKEYVTAAKTMQTGVTDNRHIEQSKFVLLGGAGRDNSSGVYHEWLANPLTIPGDWLEAQTQDNYIEWQPHDDNVLPYIHKADVVVLPSYYPEGLPRSLLESMACGKAIITTDTPGCRDAVEHKVNGLLIKPKDISSLTDAMSYMIENPNEVVRMGKASRQRILDHFSDEIVIEKTLAEYKKAGLEVKKECTMSINYSTVTELAGDEISQEQLERLCHRYYWAGGYCQNKDVLEVACGTGPGLGYLADRAHSIQAGDYDKNILAIAQNHYRERIDLQQFDAQAMPYDDNSLDVVILFEAIYYLPSAEQFVKECCRVLRDGGKVLIATANKDLYDFNPSPFSHTYYGVVEIEALFAKYGFSVQCFGYVSTQQVSLRQKILRPVKKIAVMLDLIPKTVDGKKLLKYLVFGSMAHMPNEITADIMSYTAPIPLAMSVPDKEYKVIYCAATRNKRL